MNLPVLPVHTPRVLLPLAALGIVLSACGGGGGAPVSSAAPTLSMQKRIDAATQTAQTASLCSAITPFYWEIGDSTRALVSDTVGNGPRVDTVMPIASASKWMYAAFVVQQRGAQAVDLPFLQFTSGYSNMNHGGCETNPVLGAPRQTLDACLAAPGAATVSGGSTQGAQDATTVGRFYYNSGHMTVHASAQMGLGGLTTAGIAAQVEPIIEQGTAFTHFSYSQTDMAAGVVTTAGDYARFLRNILGGPLAIGTLLGKDAVCTNPATCATASYSPVDGTPDAPLSNESWHYARGHWVEDDPTLQADGTTLGDGAFSSPGAFGFYPWIDSSKTYYGIVARQSLARGAYYASVECGRMIRKAFQTGSPQLAAPVEPAP